MEEELWTCFES